MNKPWIKQIGRSLWLSMVVASVLGLNSWIAELGGRARSVLPVYERAHRPLVGLNLPRFEGEGPLVGEPVAPTLSAAVRDLPSVAPVAEPAYDVTEQRERPSVVNTDENITNAPDPLAGRVFDKMHTPGPLFTVEGVDNLCGCSPPDTVGDVGPNHYVQMVNATTLSIYNKTGTVLVSNKALNSLWTSGGCSTSDNGDPVVVYDPLADRWVLAQFSNGNGICVAVSQTPDPTGVYYGYEFTFPTFPDYFKISVWPDAYYVGANEDTYTAIALDRSKMLSGQAASSVRFAPTALTNFAMPADLDGPTPPPANTPGYFYTFKDDAYHGGADRLEVYAFDIDWTTPANSTFTLSTTVNIASYTYTVCGFFVLSCIPQGGTTRKVDPVSEWPMFRFPYRNFGDHEALLGNFTVDVGSDRAGIRWFELRKSGNGNWVLYQEGTHAPADTLHRWMGSIAMDKNGNIALGYSRSDANTVPSIYIATRAPADPLGMLQTEALFFAGSGSQTTSTRWGDYSAMSVDPSDDCTFWFTTEYYPSNSGNNWNTRLGAVRLPDCATSVYGVSLAPTGPGAAQTGYPSQTLTYTLQITNTGNVTDTFTVALSGTTFITTAPANVGPIAAGASTTFDVGLTIPANAMAGNDTLTVTAISQGNGAQQASALLTTTVIWRRVFVPLVQK